MIHYKSNEGLLEMPSEKGNEIITIKELQNHPKIIKDQDGKDITIIEKKVGEVKKKYIETIADIWTETATPTITNKQKLDLVKNDNGVEWVVVDLTEDEIEFEIQEELEKIDAETQSKIAEGFEYDGKVFSMSLSAQSNWLYLLTLFNGGQFADEGFSIATKEDTEYLLSKDKAPEFFQAGAMAKETALAEGRKRKDELRKSYAG